MSRISSYRPIDDQISTGGGGRGPQPPAAFGGGGGGGRGDGDDAPSSRERLKSVRMGLYFTLIVILMMFVAMSTLLIARRQAGRFDPFTGEFVSTWVSIALPVKLLLVNTMVLLISSLTVEKARRTSAMETVLLPVGEIPGVAPIRQESLNWVRVTALLGFAFLAGQTLLWMQLRQVAERMSNPLSSAFVIILSGGHALHLFGGLTVLLYISFSGKLRRKYDSRSIAIDVTAWYWHFMAAIWLFVLVVLYFVH